MNQRKIKGQQLKGKIVSEFFTLFPHVFRIISQDFPFKTKGFLLKENRREENIIKRAGQIDVARQLLHVCPAPTQATSWVEWVVDLGELRGRGMLSQACSKTGCRMMEEFFVAGFVAGPLVNFGGGQTCNN